MKLAAICLRCCHRAYRQAIAAIALFPATKFFQTIQKLIACMAKVDLSPLIKHHYYDDDDVCAAGCLIASHNVQHIRSLCAHAVCAEYSAVQNVR